MNLSRHFTLAELTHSNTAQAEGIPNQPGPAETEALRALCSAVLDPLREALGRAVKVTSGYRGPALNKRIGGATSSQHLRGEAADVQAPGLPVLEVFKTVIRQRLPFDQIIYEAQNATTKWVHVSHTAAGANRGEIRVAQFGANGKPTAYPVVSEAQALAMTEAVTRGRAAPEMAFVETGDEPPQEAEAKQPARRSPAPAKKTPTRKAAAKAGKRAKKAPAKKAPR